jgi:hypothetical protein
MSLCFRAAQNCASQDHELTRSVAAAIAVLQRETTRQYEELLLQMDSEEANIVWMYLFYIRWTYNALTRTVPTGFMADAAFLAAAKTMRARHGQRHSPGPTGSLMHNASAAPRSYAPFASPTRSYSPSASPQWVICYKCVALNSHKSPVCPIISPTVAPAVRVKVKAAIATAPVSPESRAELLRICSAYYAKIDRGA